ncbi:MATE family efflux transporter [uncultured Cohaesibacter sp.]|uniref:MATE family efflux transporter n=1 Tax=uncultured Cohaesibacter sp. TaxID=1002546 RepID=UPI0029C93669|nr:MATE family efflux transporter [uncultured Cohaesibacter sp.]
MKPQDTSQENYLFERMPVPRAILVNALPTVAGMVVILIYNIADTFFVGQTNDPFQVAAVSLATPVFLLFMATGNLIGIGGTSVISRALGEKRPGFANAVSSFCFYASWIVGIIFAGVFLVEMPRILNAIGVSENTISPTRDYLMYVAPSAPFVIMGVAFGNIVRAAGKAKEAMFGMMLGTGLNIILDPFFILTLDMGVAGAAIATLIGNIVSALYFWRLVAGNRTSLSISFSDFRIRGVLWPVVAIGVPAALNNVLMSTSIIVLNNVLSSYGDIALAAMGVATKVSMIAVLLQIGLGVSIQPLLGYNYGAKNSERFRSILQTAIIYALIMGSVLTFVSWLGSGYIVKAFIEDQAVYDQGVRFVRALLLTGPVIGIMFIYINTLQAMGAAKESLVLSVSRQGFIFIPMIFVLNHLFGLSGVVYAQPVADVMAILISVALVYPHLAKYLPKHDSTGTHDKDLGSQPAQ